VLHVEPHHQPISNGAIERWSLHEVRCNRGRGYTFRGLGADGGSPWWKAWFAADGDRRRSPSRGRRRHGNDAYTKAASEDRERLFEQQIKGYLPRVLNGGRAN
jgi:hypothetical protein